MLTTEGLKDQLLFSVPAPLEFHWPVITNVVSLKRAEEELGIKFHMNWTLPEDTMVAMSDGKVVAIAYAR